MKLEKVTLIDGHTHLPAQHPLKIAENWTTKQTGIASLLLLLLLFWFKKMLILWLLIRNSQLTAQWVQIRTPADHWSFQPTFLASFVCSSPLHCAAHIFSSPLPLLTTAISLPHGKGSSPSAEQERGHTLPCCCVAALPLQIILDYHHRATDSLSCSQTSAPPPFSA